MALNIDAKFEQKLTYALKKDLRNLANFCRRFHSDLIFESKMAELNQNKTSDAMKTDAMKTLFYLGNKLIAKLTRLFTHVLQNRCS